MRNSVVMIATAVLVSSFLAGCGADNDQAVRKTGGPLGFASETTGFLLDKPLTDGPGAPSNSGMWWATFGGFVLCTEERGRYPIIEGVRFEANPEPVDVNPLFRRVPPEAEWVKTDKYGDEIAWIPMLALAGRPSDRFDGRQTLGGVITSLPGEPIKRECSDLRFQEPFVELIVEAQIGTDGAWISKTYVDYRVGDDLYTATLDAFMGGCGEITRKRDPAACGER